MIRALALRLEGALQSWGGAAAGDNRPTHEMPTRSGVVGLVGAALGIERADVSALVALHRGLALVVRVDRRGTVGVDYHTALDVPGVDGGKSKSGTITRRRYLQDASFAALLIEREGCTPDLEAIRDALRRPQFAMFLGRRACVPGMPVLASRDVLVGERWEELIDRVPLAERHDRDAGEVYVEGDLADGADAGGVKVRELNLRDRLVGPLPRMFLERRVVHLRRGAPPSVAPPMPETADTIEGWLP